MAFAVNFVAAEPYQNPLAERMIQSAMLQVVDTVEFAPLQRYEAGKYRTRPIAVNIDAMGEISSIGYDLFGEAATPGLNNSVLLRFVERYMLQLDLQLDGFKADKRCQIDKVTLTSTSLPSWVNKQTPYTLNIQERRNASLTWKAPTGEEFTISFPTDCQLILGMNALELEEYCRKAIENAEIYTPDFNRMLAKSHSIYTGNIAKLEGSDYLSDVIRNDIFLIITDSGSTPLPYHNAANPSRTVTNMMLTGWSPSPIDVELILDRYGSQTDTLHVKLNSLISFIHHDGCTPYFGIKAIDSKVVTGTIFAPNPQLGYNHVISVEVPRCVLSDNCNNAIKARIYAYIPLQNVVEHFFFQDLSPLPNNMQ